MSSSYDYITYSHSHTLNGFFVIFRPHLWLSFFFLVSFIIVSLSSHAVIFRCYNFLSFFVVILCCCQLSLSSLVVIIGCRIFLSHFIVISRCCHSLSPFAVISCCHLFLSHFTVIFHCHHLLKILFNNVIIALFDLRLNFSSVYDLHIICNHPGN